MTDPTDIHFMQQALALAQHAQTQGEVPVGALLVHNHEVIAQGWNCPIRSHDPTAHAEIVTLRQAAEHVKNYRLPHTTLYVTLEPCIMCAGAMLHARVQRLVFGATDPRAGAVVSAFQVLQTSTLNHRIEFTGNVLEEPCAKLLKDFFEAKRTHTHSNSQRCQDHPKN